MYFSWLTGPFKSNYLNTVMFVLLRAMYSVFIYHSGFGNSSDLNIYFTISEQKYPITLGLRPESLTLVHFPSHTSLWASERLGQSVYDFNFFN